MKKMILKRNMALAIIAALSMNLASLAYNTP